MLLIRKGNMTRKTKLKKEVLDYLKAETHWNTKAVENFKDWADAYYFSREDLAEILWDSIKRKET
jgi:hypothetical protein